MTTNAKSLIEGILRQAELNRKVPSLLDTFNEFNIVERLNFNFSEANSFAFEEFRYSGVCKPRVYDSLEVNFIGYERSQSALFVNFENFKRSFLKKINFTPTDQEKVLALFVAIFTFHEWGHHLSFNVPALVPNSELNTGKISTEEDFSDICSGYLLFYYAKKHRFTKAKVELMLKLNAKYLDLECLPKNDVIVIDGEKRSTEGHADLDTRLANIMNGWGIAERGEKLI
jgi:hypothetical protein